MTHMTHAYFQRSGTWLIPFFFLVSGISVGVFTELSLPADSRAQVGAYLVEHLFADNASPDHSAVLLQSAGNNLGLLLLIFLSGLTAIGFPVAYAAVAYKGAALGFSAALLLDFLQLKGLATLVLTVLPPNLLILPALFLGVAAAGANAADHRSGTRRKKSLAQEAGPYCTCFVPPLLLAAIAALIDAFICPALLQLIK